MDMVFQENKAVQLQLLSDLEEKPPTFLCSRVFPSHFIRVTRLNHI